MKNKVCHFTSTHNPKDQRIFYKECLSLSKAGYDVSLVEQGDSEECQGVHIIGTGEKKNGRLYRLLVRPRKVYELARNVNAQIYHFHDMELIPYGLRLKKLGKKVIFDYHEDYASRFSDSYAFHGPRIAKKLLGKIYTYYEKTAIKRFDTMISVTPHICNRLKLSNKNTYMITNYPLTSHEKWNNRNVYNRDSDYIAFAGQIGSVYKIPLIVKAIQEVPHIRIKLCGPIRTHAEYEEVLKEDINKKVDYLGVLPYMDIPNFISNSRAAVVLCEHNTNTAGDIGTLGNNKLFEYMSCGVPVICTDFLLWKEIVERYKCGICTNDTSVRNAIDFIINHPDEAEQMGRNGQRAVLEEYNWKTQEKILLCIYSDLLQK